MAVRQITSRKVHQRVTSRAKRFAKAHELREAAREQGRTRALAKPETVTIPHAIA